MSKKKNSEISISMNYAKTDVKPHFFNVFSPANRMIPPVGVNAVGKKPNALMVSDFETLICKFI